MMSQKAKKCEGNNQWAGQKAAAKATQYHDKTEFSNEWVSTNKVADCNHPTEKNHRVIKKSQDAIVHISIKARK